MLLARKNVANYKLRIVKKEDSVFIQARRLPFRPFWRNMKIEVETGTYMLSFNNEDQAIHCLAKHVFKPDPPKPVVEVIRSHRDIMRKIDQVHGA